MVKNFELNNKNTHQKKVNLHEPKMEKIVFNFSFITSDKGYKLNDSSEIHSKFIEKIQFLSQDDFDKILSLPKKQGLEKISEKHIKHVHCPQEFLKTWRKEKTSDDYWIFRLSSKGRVLGKMIDKTFYVIGIDTKFNSYSH